jgi:MtrB/PioB family decaheme-associated outer membrane protein
MKTLSPLLLLGTLSAAVGSAYAVDTSKWKCESCPFEKEGFHATVNGGVGTVSEKSPKFGDYTGLDDDGPYLDLGGSAQFRSAGGFYGGVTGSDLGLDSRSLGAEIGRDGLFGVRLGYAQIPRHLTTGAASPFLGFGGPVLSLPAGFPAGTTAGMPLASTLQPVELGYKRQRFDLGATGIAGTSWTFGLSWRRDVRDDGAQRTAGSFFSTASHLGAPVDQTTDQVEASVSFLGRAFQASLAASVSQFRNNQEALTWANPFTPLAAGATTGQLALAPDNKFTQVLATAGYDITPRIRASGEVAAGRMTQDSPYLAATLNGSLGTPAQLALPAQSLDGSVDTFNASLRLSATPIAPLRLNASYARDEHDNRTASRSYPGVVTDTFLDPVARTNQPFSFSRDRFKVSGDYRLSTRLKASAGADYDTIDRTLQEVATTKETTVWGKASVQALQNVSLSAKLTHAGRDISGYGVAGWVNPPENPLLRKYNLADRRRNTGGGRVDATFAEIVSIGLHYDASVDDYRNSTIGLLDGRSAAFGGDVAVAVSDNTHVVLYAQSEHIRSRQAGSQVFAQPDWSAHGKDVTHVGGLGVKHSALAGKLVLGGDLGIARSRSDVRVDAGPADPPFPTARTTRETLKLRADYRVLDNLSVLFNYWYERYKAEDWRLDGVLPGTIPNLLALGEQVPDYRVHVVGVSVRYRIGSR